MDKEIREAITEAVSQANQEIAHRDSVLADWEIEGIVNRAMDNFRLAAARAAKKEIKSND